MLETAPRSLEMSSRTSGRRGCQVPGRAKEQLRGGKIGWRVMYDDARNFSDGASWRGWIGRRETDILCGRTGGAAHFIGGDRGARAGAWRTDDAGTSRVAVYAHAERAGPADKSTAESAGAADESATRTCGITDDASADECSARRYERAGVALGAVRERFRSEGCVLPGSQPARVPPAHLPPDVVDYRQARQWKSMMAGDMSRQ